MTLQESDDSLHRFAVASRDITRHLGQESQEDDTAEHPFRKARKDFQGCADRWDKGGQSQAYAGPHSHESVDNEENNDK